MQTIDDTLIDDKFHISSCWNNSDLSPLQITQSASLFSKQEKDSLSKQNFPSKSLESFFFCSTGFYFFLQFLFFIKFNFHFWRKDLEYFNLIVETADPEKMFKKIIHGGQKKKRNISEA